MIVPLLLVALVLTLVKACTLLIRHSQRESSRHATDQVHAAEMELAAKAGLVRASDFKWTAVDDRQLARYISEVSS